jgi:AAA+ superfamily predicted ATPase
MTKANQIARAIKMLDEVDSILQEVFENCYDLYETVNNLMDEIESRAKEEGIDLPE